MKSKEFVDIYLKISSYLEPIVSNYSSLDDLVNIPSKTAVQFLLMNPTVLKPDYFIWYKRLSSVIFLGYDYLLPTSNTFGFVPVANVRIFDNYEWDSNYDIFLTYEFWSGLSTPLKLISSSPSM